MSIVFVSGRNVSHIYICKWTFKIPTNLLNPAFLYVAAVGLLHRGIQPNESAILLFPLLHNYGISTTKVPQCVYVLSFSSSFKCAETPSKMQKNCLTLCNRFICTRWQLFQ